MQFFEKLVSLPLFTGMSSTELEKTIEKTKFEFRKHQPGDIVVREGDRCGQLLLLVDGEVEITTQPDDRGYSVVERLSAPLPIQLQLTFGLSQRYTSTVRSASACNFIIISKSEALRLTSESLVFRLNLLNLLSTSVQKSTHALWRKAPQNLRERMCFFLAAHCLKPSGPKTFFITMVRMAQELNETRKNISDQLQAMREEKLIKLGRGRIEITAMEKLVGG